MLVLSGLTMASVLAGVGIVLLWHVASALTVDRQQKPGDVVQPEIVIPGEWMTDPSDHFLFLPLTVPADMAATQLKVMTNGESLLVVVTERPKEEPETNALRKYKLVVEAIKTEVGHDEDLLVTKLQTWLDTEDDDEVKQHIQAALDSLVHVRKSKDKDSTKSVSVSLGMPHHADASSLLELSETPLAAKPVAAAQVTTLRGAGQHIHHHHHARVIKESFAVEVPYPVPTENILLLNTKPGMMMVAMPLVRHSMEAKGISTGGKPFLRVPVFNGLGKWIGGPRADLGKVAAGLDLAAAVSQKGFEPLSDD